MSSAAEILALRNQVLALTRKVETLTDLVRETTSPADCSDFNIDDLVFDITHGDGRQLAAIQRRRRAESRAVQREARQ